MNKPLISIIIPTFNSGKYLEKCLESIKKQTYQHIEVIIVDQSSADDTPSIARRYGVTLISIPRPEFYSPPSKSRNIGAKKAKGQILYHLDSDMELSHALVEEFIEKFKNKNIGALIVDEVDITKGFWSKCKALERKTYAGNQHVAGARVVRTALFRKIGGYDEDISSGEDFDITKQYRKYTTVVYCKNPVYHNLGELSFITLIKKKYNYGKTAGAYFKKHTGESGGKLLFIELASYCKNYQLFLQDPLVGIGTIVLKFFEFGFGGLGLLRSSLDSKT